MNKINEIDKLIARMGRRKRTFVMTNIRNERDITANSTPIKSTVREYYEQLYAIKLNNLDVMGINY